MSGPRRGSPQALRPSCCEGAADKSPRGTQVCASASSSLGLIGHHTPTNGLVLSDPGRHAAVLTAPPHGGASVHHSGVAGWREPDRTLLVVAGAELEATSLEMGTTAIWAVTPASC